MPKFIIRTADPTNMEYELQRIQDFYAENRHSGNAIRNPEVLMRSIIDNKAYLVDDDNSNSLLAVSFCFSINDGDYTEFGGTRVKAEGYGLQKLMTYLRAMNEFMMDPPSHEAYTVIANWNDKSRYNIISTGFEGWEPSDDLLKSIKFNAKDEKTFFRLPRSSLEEIKHKLLDIVDAGHLSNKAGLEPAELEFKNRIISERRLTRDLEF